ncbi:hypothetical protein HI914_06979 [Erysiphe necator]|nr:hypothetical protein HI914_06979 [Erysiphe necator]
MPRKRFNTRYSKPASTTHSSLVSTVSSLSNKSYQQPTVNELIESLRRSDLASIRASSAIVNIPTLPPELRRLLAQPEIPVPRPRFRNSGPLDINLGTTAAGPAAPRSWLSGQLNCHPRSQEHNREKRNLSFDIDHLPGLFIIPKTSLREQCLRALARNWDFIKEYEKNYLAYLPTRLRSMLLSHIAVYGPKTGVGFSGLKNLIFLTDSETDDSYSSYRHNKNFSRLDLSGAIGSSLSIEQVLGLVRYKSENSAESSNLSWEDNLDLSTSLSPPLSHLTHLSLSHPPTNVSWSALLSLVVNLPALTHLSLAYWPLPISVLKRKLAIFNDILNEDDKVYNRNQSTEVLDEYFSEATRVLRNLANRLPGLEYLDLTGCQSWFKVLVAYSTEDLYRGIEWGKSWTQLKTLKLNSGIEVTKESQDSEVQNRMQIYELAVAVENKIISLLRQAKIHGMKFSWINVIKDDLDNLSII